MGMKHESCAFGQAFAEMGKLNGGMGCLFVLLYSFVWSGNQGIFEVLLEILKWEHHVG